MSDRMRLMGMTSGMDTESIVQQLVSVKKTNVTNLKNDQKKLQWKQEQWQDLNKKIYGFYSSSLTELRFSSAYKKKTTKISDTTKLSVVAGNDAPIGIQTMKINKLAKSGYITGSKLGLNITTDKDGKIEKRNWESGDKLSDITSDLVGKKISIKVGQDATVTPTEIEITSDMTISQFTNKLSAAGVNASFDSTNNRFFISAKDTGKEKDFVITSDEITSGMSALAALGLETDANKGGSATRIEGQDAEIELNGAKFESSSNTITINNNTYTLLGTTAADEEISVVTTNDFESTYDTIKDLLSEYNEVINSIYKKYNADSARKYNMLSDDEKEAMSDDEVEKWENTIKDSLLRRDSTLSTIMESLSEITTKGYDINGKTLHLSDFGIGTLSYFEAADDERRALHIDGDKDDDKTNTKADKLKLALSKDPEEVADFFAAVCKDIYGKLDKLMASTDYSSIYKVYNDKQLKKEYDDYTKKIKEAEQKLSDYEDKWYDKFAAMETAMSKMQSNQNAVSSMLG